MPTTRDEALKAKGRFCSVNQRRAGEPREWPPFWYGRIVDVHSSGDYLKFDRGAPHQPHWYHRDDVHLHPATPAA